MPIGTLYFILSNHLQFNGYTGLAIPTIVGFIYFFVITVELQVVCYVIYAGARIAQGCRKV